MCDHFEPWLGIEGSEHGGRQAIVVHENGILADEVSAVTRDVEVEDRFDRADLDVGDLDAPGELPQHVSELQFPCHRPSLPRAPETVIRGRDDFFVSKAQAERGHGRIVVQADDRLVRQTSRLAVLAQHKVADPQSLDRTRSPDRQYRSALAEAALTRMGIGT